MKYYSWECINYSRGRKITCGNEILLGGIQYYSRKWIITRGKKYYYPKRIITRGNVLITRGTEILLAETNYYSRECNITRGKELLLAGEKYYSWERIITRGNLFITRGDNILLAGEKYWQHMAPEGFRTTRHGEWVFFLSGIQVSEITARFYNLIRCPAYSVDSSLPCDILSQFMLTHQPTPKGNSICK